MKSLFSDSCPHFSLISMIIAIVVVMSVSVASSQTNDAVEATFNGFDHTSVTNYNGIGAGYLHGFGDNWYGTVGVGVNSVTQNSATTTNYAFSLEASRHFNDVGPCIVSYGVATQYDHTASNTFTIGAIISPEYFFWENLSLGFAYELGYAATNNSGPSAITLASGGTITSTFYW